MDGVVGGEVQLGDSAVLFLRMCRLSGKVRK